jgi:hypothetical protein
MMENLSRTAHAGMISVTVFSQARLGVGRSHRLLLLCKMGAHALSDGSFTGTALNQSLAQVAATVQNGWKANHLVETNIHCDIVIALTRKSDHRRAQVMGLEPTTFRLEV